MFRKLIITSLSIFGLSYILSGISVDTIWTALIASLILGLLNIFLKPILLLLSLPVNILTLGLFTLVINALIMMTAAYLVSGLTITSFGWAFLFSLMISLINSIFELFKK
jgi:putative membrane protein